MSIIKKNKTINGTKYKNLKMKYIENLRHLYLAFVITMTHDTFEELANSSQSFPLHIKMSRIDIYIVRYVCCLF